MSGIELRPDGPPKSGRVDAIDLARGLALIGMAYYHLTWDLADVRLAPPMLPFSPAMRILSHVVASAFLALVGVSLALAHRDRVNLHAFWRRLAIIAGAAALVTAASMVLFPGQIIWFGILHCIAVASLAAAPFIQAPAWTSLLAGAAAIAAPFFVHSRLFDPPALLWLGIGEALPNTVDWRPFLPWGGAVLVGLGLARLPGALAQLTDAWRWRAKSPVARAVSFGGRHSLAVYLLHQCVLYPLVWAIAASGLVAAVPLSKPDYSAFLAACEHTCVAPTRTAEDCENACRCVADAVERSGQADRLGALDSAGRAKLKRLVDACMGGPVTQ